MRSTRAVVLPKGLLDVDQCSFGELAGGSTVNLRTPAASGVRPRSQLMAAVLAPRDDSEVSNRGWDDLPSYPCRRVRQHRIWVFGRKRKARFEPNARIPLRDGKGSQNDDGTRG